MSETFTAETSPHDVGLARLNNVRFDLLRDRFRLLEATPIALEEALAEVKQFLLPSLRELTDEQKTDALWGSYNDILCRFEPKADKASREVTLEAMRMLVPEDHMRFVLTSILAHYGIHPGHPLQTTGQEHMVDKLILEDGALEKWFPYELIADMENPPPQTTVVDKVLTTPTEDTFDDVPTGKAELVLDWVDGDQDRARRAAQAEVQRKGAKARKTLMGKLESLVDPKPRGRPKAEDPPELTVIEGGADDEEMMIPDGYRLVIALASGDEVTHWGVIRAELVDELWP